MRNITMHNSILIKLSCIFLCSLIIHAPYADAEVENRIILDEDFNWLTPQSADKLLSRIKAAGFNVFVPCVWHGKGVTWLSELAPKEPGWDKNYPQNYDPLEYLIKKAHSLGIEVHPWFTVMLRQNGILNQFDSEGLPDKSFNVHLPEFRKYIVALMLEVVKKYEIDGVNLDYIRSKGICSSNYCIDDYKARTGRNLYKDKLLHKVSDESWENIAEWNRKSVESIVSEFYRKAKSIKPDLIVSVDSHAGYRPLLLQGTDSIAWLNSGIIDVIFHMDYKLDIDIPAIMDAKSRLKEPERLVLMVGNYDRIGRINPKVSPRDAEKTRNLINLSRQYGSNTGVALYEYRFLTDAQVDQLRSGPFKLPARSGWGFY